MGREVGMFFLKLWRKGKGILRSISVGYKLVPFNVLSETQVKVGIPF